MIVHGAKVASESYQRYALCKEFKWDYWTYEAQPAWFIEELSVILNIEAQKEQKDAKKAEGRKTSPNPTIRRR